MLHVHRSAKGGSLVRALAGALTDPLADPFAADVVAVPAKGVERWLSQRLSHHLGVGSHEDGVAANLDFPSPAKVLDAALAASCPEHAAVAEAWASDAVTWPLLTLIDGLQQDDVFAPVHHYLRSGVGRRYALAAKVSRLFDSYGRDRPELLCAWGNGTDDCPEDLAWQPEIWRRLRKQLGPSPAELHAEALASLRKQPVDLPERLSLYGVTRLTRTRLDVLAAVAESIDVHVFVHHSGAALWDRVGSAPVQRRSDDVTGERVAHPLLTSLSRDVRELQQRLLQAVPDLITETHDVGLAGELLLQRLQRDLRTDSVPTSRPKAEETDRSVQVHACHGEARQVEVLREVLLQILKDDESLEPRDILVMCPDVERYAPLVKAVFDTDSHPGGSLRVQIADRSLTQTNPLLGLATRLMELAGSRLTGPQVLDLGGMTAVREQFGLSDDDLEQLRGWTVASQIRWGMDGESRAPWGLDGLDDGTWRRGLDRVLAGVAFGGSETPYEGTLPLGGIDSTDIDLVGRFAELLDRLDAAMQSLRGQRTVSEWLSRLETAVLQLGLPTRDGDWQVAQLGRVLGDVRAAAQGASVDLTIADVRVLLEQLLAGRPTRSSFRTGAVTVCTMTPMRSVPHKVICLLGMDDTAFPRHGIPDGDDLLARDPWLGERDPRSEDRQLFLDAILAAEQRLVITYSGADPRIGAALPPAVPVGELLDALERTAEGAREHVVIRHPLQPFDARSFTSGALGAEGPFSFDRSAYAGAQALQADRVQRDPFLPSPLEPVTEEALTLRELKDFWEHPCKAFLRQRLQVFSSTRDEEPRDAISLDLDGLEDWAIGDRILRARMAGVSRDILAEAEKGRGDLPPGAIGDEHLDKVNARVDALAIAVKPYLAGEPDSLDVDLRLTSTCSLTGSVPLRGDVVLHIGYSTLGNKQRLRVWIDLLAATATDGVPRQAVVVGRKKEEAVVEVFGPVAPARARELLEELVALRAIGLRAPLALPLDAGAAYAVKRKEGSDTLVAKDAAAFKWKSPYGFDGPDRDADHVLVWGPEEPFGTIWGWSSPVPLPPGAGGEPNDFARLAVRLWYPLLDAEVTA